MTSQALIPIPRGLDAAGAEPLYLSTIENALEPHRARSVPVRWRECGWTARSFVPDGWTIEETAILVCRGVETLDADPDAPLRPGDHVVYARVPGTLAFVAKVFLAVLISLTIAQLTAPDAPARRQRDDSSPTYGWSGIRTNYQPAGMPYPVIYGAHWTGGFVVQVYTRTVGSVTTLYLLIGLSLGPVESIGGIYEDRDELSGAALPPDLVINDNKASNYSGLRVWTRLGRLGQDIIAPFAETNTLYSIDLLLDYEDGTYATDAVEYQTTQLCDRGRLTLRFPEGLYEINSNNNTTKKLVQFSARYRPTDSGGTPTGDWVDLYDGASTIINVEKKIRQSVLHDLEFPFFDPNGFQPPSLEDAQRFDGTQDYATTAIGVGILGEPEWVSPDVPVQGMTVILRIAHRTDAQPYNGLWDWTTGNTYSGLAPLNLQGIAIAYQSIGVKSYATVWIGDGIQANMRKIQSPYAQDKDDGWTELAVTYDRGGGAGGTNRVRIRVDGVLRHSEDITTEMLTHSSRTFVGAISGKQTDDDWLADVDFDEILVYSRVLDGGELNEHYNDRRWEAVDPEEESRLVIYYQFERQGGQTHDQTGNGNELIYQSATNTIAGKTSFLPTGDLLRSHYLIQVVRKTPFDESATVGNLARLHAFTAILDDEVAYTGVALLGMAIEATDQLHDNQPNALVRVEGRSDCPVWTGNDPDHPTFTRQYSANPAHHIGHYLTDEDVGGGLFHGEDDVDWEDLDLLADFCAGEVYDQRGKWVGRQFVWTGVFDQDFPGGRVEIVFDQTDLIPHLSAGRRIRIANMTAEGTGKGWEEGDVDVVSAYPSGGGTYTISANWWGSGTPTTTTQYADVADVYGIEPRLEQNVVLADRGLDFWDGLLRMCAVARAIPVPRGDRVGFVFQEDRDPVTVFNAANMRMSSFRMSVVRKEEKFNHATAEIQNQDQRNERSVVARAHSSLRDSSSSVKRRPTSFDFVGVTNVSQARRELDYRLNRSQAEDIQLEFDTLADGGFLPIGSVAIVSYPLPSWSVGGQAFSDSGDDASIVIDVEVVLEAATTYYCAVRGSDDVVAFVEVTSVAGTYDPGDTITLASTLGFTPQEGDLWSIGTAVFGSKIFQAVDHQLHQNMAVALRLVEFDGSVFVDEDEFDDLPLHSQDGPSFGKSLFTDAGLLAATTSRGALPTPDDRVTVSEESFRDPDTGALAKAIRVGWEPDPLTEHLIARTDIWLRDAGSGVVTRIGSAGGTEREYRAAPTDLVRGAPYELVVQHITAAGLKVPLARAPRGRITLLGIFPYGKPLGAARVTVFGEQVAYEADLSADFADYGIEVIRGGSFLGQEVCRIPRGGATSGPTDDWYVGPKAIPVFFRPTSAEGSRGRPQKIEPVVIPHGYSALDLTAYEDGPWDTKPGGASVDPSLGTELEIDPEFGWLRFKDASTATAGVYETWEIDLGVARRVHVGFAVEAVQETPAEFEQIQDSPLSNRMLGWTGQGPLSPHDPAFGRVVALLEWQRSETSSDPSGETWVRFRPCRATIRSARFRVTITRPDDTWNVRVLKAGSGIHAAPLDSILTDCLVVSEQDSTDINAAATDNLVPWDRAVMNHGTTFSHSTVTNPSRITVNADGTYGIAVLLSYTGDGTGISAPYNGIMRVRKNGSTNLAPRAQNGLIGYSLGGSHNQASLSLPLFFEDLVAGDYLEVLVDRETSNTDGSVLDALRSRFTIFRKR